MTPLTRLRKKIRGTKQVTVEGDKAYDTADFVAECRNLNVMPHAAQDLELRDAVRFRQLFQRF